MFGHHQDAIERYFSQGSNKCRQEWICISIYLFSLIPLSNIKDGNKINNNYWMPHTHISSRKRQ